MTAFALLGSGEFEPWAEPVDRWLLDRAAEAGRDGSVLILPTASAPEGDAVFDKWGTMGLEHYAALQAPAEVVPLKTREDAASEELAAGLATASVVFFSGGNPAYLATTLAGTAFWTRVVAELDRGLSFGGCSAGIACLGQVAPDSAATRFGDDMWKPGLELFPGVVFGPHWDMLDTYIPGLRDVIVQGVPEGSRLLAVDERTAVLGDGQRWRVQGSGTASLYDAGTWERFGPGAAFEAELRPSPA